MILYCPFYNQRIYLTNMKLFKKLYRNMMIDNCTWNYNQIYIKNIRYLQSYTKCIYIMYKKNRCFFLWKNTSYTFYLISRTFFWSTSYLRIFICNNLTILQYLLFTFSFIRSPVFRVFRERVKKVFQRTIPFNVVILWKNLTVSLEIFGLSIRSNRWYP